MHLPEIVHDAALPLTWTPTTGNNIPASAVPLHEGPNGQLYIARGLLAGEMHIGTTSYSSSEGARLRDRYGRNHAVFEYEVLTLASSVRFYLEPAQPPTLVAETAETTPVPTTRTPHRKLEPFPWIGAVYDQPVPAPREREGKWQSNDPPPYMSPVGGWVEVPKEARPVALNQRESVQFKNLAQSKCFTLIDDTPSMQNSWSQTRAALAGMVDILSSEDNWDGVDVRFLQHAQARSCIKTRDEFESVFNSVTTWRGDKVMATKVTQVFEECLPLVLGASAPPRPVVLLIVTDSIADDAQQLLNVMIGFSQRLNGKCVPPHMFRIHILQMGDDRKAVKPLHDFRDRITQRDRDRRILNVVSYHRGRGLLNAQSIVKLLLGSTYVSVEEDPDLRGRQSPKVVEAQYQEVERIRVMASR